MGSWGHFENRSKAALGNKKARFHCARLHLHCSHVMRLYRTNLIINNLKERTNHGKTIETSLARDPNPLWRGRSQIHEENGDAAVILLQMSFEVLLFFLFISFFITTAKVQKIYETQTTSYLTCFYSVSYDKNGNLSFLKTRSTVGGTRTLG